MMLSSMPHATFTLPPLEIHAAEAADRAAMRRAGTSPGTGSPVPA